SALTSALSGLRAHQLFLDVVGNNLANASTIGFKSSRLTFADALSETLRTGSAPTTTVGGVNPMQIGLGVQVHSNDTNEQQGVLDQTGRPLDLGIQGEGYFVLRSGTHTYYTRAGIFGLDNDAFVVDSATGYRVQDVNGSDIQLPLDTLLPPKATTTIS